MGSYPEYGGMRFVKNFLNRLSGDTVALSSLRIYISVSKTFLVEVSLNFRMKLSSPISSDDLIFISECLAEFYNYDTIEESFRLNELHFFMHRNDCTK
jgi:hypothetical protein